MSRPGPGFPIAAILGACLSWGCEFTRPDEDRKDRAAPLRVAAASDLQTALPALARRFTGRTRVQMSLTFGASGQLAEQISQGAPFDVFLSANRKFVDDLAAAGHIRPDSVRSYARGSLVLAVRLESAGLVESLHDLSRPEVKKVSLANPETAPYGAAGKQALERSGLWADLSPKIVQAESVRQALQFVQTGNAEAGFVGRAIASVPEVRIVNVDDRLYDPIIQKLGIVARTDRGNDAESFTRFVASVEGQAVLGEFGFARVEPGVEPAPKPSPESP